jgi:formylglycine-generating enzyme required for sulfatase activity
MPARFRTLVLSALLCCSSLRLPAQDTRVQPDGEIMPGPTQPGEWAAWLAEMKLFRTEKHIRMGYSGAEYARPELQWSQRNFIQPQVMVEDRFIYDPVTRQYTVGRYLDDLNKRYGGIDSVLLWPVYPNIGIDNRSQFDLHEDLPGGLEGLKQMIADFHRRGVKVFWPTMAWDTGTRDSGRPQWTDAARIAAATGADGINGDTFRGMPRAYKTATDSTGHPVILEPENPMESDEQLAWNTQSWGYWKYPWIPGVSRYKWLEPRHMVNICDRWAKDKTDNLQAALFNGVGYESWENIWGIWNGITPRDAEALRRVSRILRATAPALVSPDWEPHFPTLRYGIFASRFPTGENSVFTIVNRNPYDLDGRQIQLPWKTGARFFDLYHGVELKPEINGAAAILSFPMEARGFGAIAAVYDGDRAMADAKFLAEMKVLTAKPLKEFSHEWKALPQQLVAIPSTPRSATAPAGMVAIPAASFEFITQGIMIEGGNDEGVDVQYPWEPSARRHHRHVVNIPAFFIDRHPVTNAEFKKFLDASHYRPADDHNFLRDWTNGAIPSGWENKPVTWVSLEDARAYAKWAGKRLPHEWEWQYAAQGTDGRLYPWGNDSNPALLPPQDASRERRPPSDVGQFPHAASPFGVMDLVGHVWQWTDEFTDDHTRAAILKGGSYYRPQGSRWYFPNTHRLDQHGKYLLMAPSKDRAGTLGFRCVVDR